MKETGRGSGGTPVSDGRCTTASPVSAVRAVRPCRRLARELLLLTCGGGADGSTCQCDLCKVRAAGQSGACCWVAAAMHAGATCPWQRARLIGTSTQLPTALRASHHTSHHSIPLPPKLFAHQTIHAPNYSRTKLFTHQTIRAPNYSRTRPQLRELLKHTRVAHGTSYARPKFHVTDAHARLMVLGSPCCLVQRRSHAHTTRMFRALPHAQGNGACMFTHNLSLEMPVA